MRISALPAVGLVLACIAGPAWAVNKCTLADGRVVYQDAACAGAAASSERVKTWGNTPGDSSGGGAGLRLPPPKLIDWTNSADGDLVRAEALLDAMRTQGRDCEWALKVTKGASISAKCVPFLAAFQPGGSFGQINQRVLDLLTDKAWAANARRGLNRVLGVTEEVVRQKEIMMAHLGAQ